jgi:hypothetical protein
MQGGGGKGKRARRPFNGETVRLQRQVDASQKRRYTGETEFEA